MLLVSSLFCASLVGYSLIIIITGLCQTPSKRPSDGRTDGRTDGRREWKLVHFSLKM